jgi:hypothetical protein
MKATNLLSIALILSVMGMGCKKEVVTTPQEAARDVNPATAVANNSDFNTIAGRPSTTAVCNADAYIITLESVNYTGSTWEWIWSVQNPNPGNGTNGTVQNLSHWGMQFGACFNLSSIVSAAYSGDNTNWTSFNPTYAVDPSQGCFTAPVFKFDFGTSGSNKSYYKIEVNQIYSVAASVGYFKSGNRTGCCTFSFPGFSCGGQIEE